MDLSKTRFDHHFNLLLSKCKEEDFGEPKKYFDLPLKGNILKRIFLTDRFIVLEWLGQLAHREYR